MGFCGCRRRHDIDEDLSTDEDLSVDEDLSADEEMLSRPVLRISLAGFLPADDHDGDPVDWGTQVAQVYCTDGRTVLPLREILSRLTSPIPKSATHFFIRFFNPWEQEFGMMFSLQHQDDMFPAECADYFIKRPLEERAKSIFLYAQGTDRPLDVDMFQPFSWKGFQVGSVYRPHAWTWLHTLLPEDNDEASLVAIDGDGNVVTIDVRSGERSCLCRSEATPSLASAIPAPLP